MTKYIAALSGLFAIAFATLALDSGATPVARIVQGVIAAMFAAAAVLGWLTHRRERTIKPAATLWPDGDDLPTWSYHQLVAKHDEGQRLMNEGSPAAPGDEALYAIEEALRHRGVPLCGCGAAPGGVHLTNCPEKP